jgi:hypothetical protein
LVKVTVVLRILSITLSRDDKATTSDTVLGRNNVVVIGGDAHVRTRESDRYSLSFSGWKSIGIFLVGTALPTDLQAGEIRVWSHLVMVALHLATITDRYR